MAKIICPYNELESLCTVKGTLRQSLVLSDLAAKNVKYNLYAESQLDEFLKRLSIHLS